MENEKTQVEDIKMQVENGKTQVIDEKTQVEKRITKTEQLILNEFKNNPKNTLANVAASIDKSLSAVERASKKLKQKGFLKHQYFLVYENYGSYIWRIEMESKLPSLGGGNLQMYSLLFPMSKLPTL